MGFPVDLARVSARGVGMVTWAWAVLRAAGRVEHAAPRLAELAPRHLVRARENAPRRQISGGSACDCVLPCSGALRASVSSADSPMDSVAEALRNFQVIGGA